MKRLKWTLIVTVIIQLGLIILLSTTEYLPVFLLRFLDHFTWLLLPAIFMFPAPHGHPPETDPVAIWVRMVVVLIVNFALHAIVIYCAVSATQNLRSLRRTPEDNGNAS